VPEAVQHLLVTHGFVARNELQYEAGVAAGVAKLIAAWDEATARWDLSAVWPSNVTRDAAPSGL
jgi:hypothetical protein